MEDGLCSDSGEGVAMGAAAPPRWLPGRFLAIKIAIVYALAGAAWILASGWALHAFVHQPHLEAVLETVKGWCYVGVTALLLGAALDRYFARIRRSARELQDSETRLHLLGDNLPGSYVYQYMNTVGGGSHFTYLSAGVERVHGVPAEAVLRDARVLHGQIDPAQMTALVAAESESARTLSDFAMELRIRRPDGEERFVHVRSRPRRVTGDVVVWDGVGVDVTDRRQAETALKETREMYRSLFMNMMNSVVHARVIFEGERPVDMEYISVNPAFAAVTGITEPVEGRRITEVIPGYAASNPESLETFGRVAATGVPTRWEHYLRELDRWFAFMIYSPARGEVVIVTENITERKRAETELRQAQKMESVGRLAGGVAHDFNNLLMGIMNYAELCRDAVPPSHVIRPWLDEITADVQRSARITRQLLAFARKEPITPVVLDLNDHVAGTLKMLRRLIGEDIDLAWLPEARHPAVKMDPAQVDQILTNLALNARDAIAGVGTVTVETRDAVVDEHRCAGTPGAVPGDFVMLAVSDTGCGLAPETFEHLFEPFFTTKGVGKGTGLGLATVYGIVRQNGGFIEVESVAGKGTTFRIYLPRCAGAVLAEGALPAARPCPRGSESVLLAEDERSIRVTTKSFLESLGYAVVAAEGPETALAAAHARPFDLLITDVIMPKMSGRDLADRVHEIHPGLRCLFMSGYTADVIAHRGVLEDGVDFLRKPFGREQLAVKVREILDRPA